MRFLHNTLLSCALLLNGAVVGQAFAGTAALAELKTELDRAKAAQGHSLDEKEFSRLVHARTQNLSGEEYRQAWRYWVDSLTPPISRHDLAARFRAKRLAMHDVTMVYSTQTQGESSAGAEEATEWKDHEFLLSGNRILSRTVQRKPPQSQGDLSVWSTDGRTTRFYGKLEKPHHENPSGQDGLISPADTLGLLYADQHHSPLAAAMLLDSVSIWGSPMPFLDLAAMLEFPSTVVLEQPEVVGGVKTIVVVMGLPVLFKVKLDPARDYAVVRMESYAPIAGATGPSSGTLKNSSCLCEDLEKVAEGIWLPRKITNELYVVGGDRSKRPVGSPKTRVVTNVKRLAVNKGIDDAAFANAFPPGTYVRDETTKAIYIVGQEPPATSGPSSAPADAWTRYARQFIDAYKLNDDQQQTAWSILKGLKGRAQEYRASHSPDYEAIGRLSDKSQRDRELQSLHAPIDGMFQELKDRLMAIPTAAQRAAAAAAGPLSQPAAGGSRSTRDREQ